MDTIFRLHVAITSFGIQDMGSKYDKLNQTHTHTHTHRHIYFKTKNPLVKNVQGQVISQ